ncbi:MAG TPA: hypothetical protein VFD82_05605 [Planctomycetota bacterium]|nr:hypothetical protein [Planctomycetota bacterium]
MKWLHVTAAFAASTAWLLAQAQTPPVPQDPPKPTNPAKVTEEKAQLMREHMDTGRPLQSHVRVAVRLKNDNTLRGVVKDGKLVERVDGLRFVDAQAKEQGAGIRLWYTTGVRNYVFIPFSQFAEYEVLQRLSQEDLEEIERELQREEASRAGAAAAPAAPAVEPRTGEQGKDAKDKESKDKDAKDKEGKGDTAGKDAAPNSEQEQTRAWFQLVQAYPPTAGWNATKRDEIMRRKVVIGATPSESEMRFVEKFAEWQKACAHFGVEATPKPAEPEAAEPTRRTSRRD